MIRPCYLVIDREFSSGISSRKLVIETAKFNVITAYNSAEAIETLRTFPAVHGAVVDGHMNDISCDELVSKLKQIKPGLPVIAIGTDGGCGIADHYVESFSPVKLLALLQQLHPKETHAIENRAQQLSTAESEQA